MSQSCSSVAESDSSTLEYEQESFATFRVKIVQLCIDIGLGTPSEVERMSGGSFNRVIGITLSSPTALRYVVRIPRMVLDQIEVQNIKDQVAVLKYLSAYLPVAKVIAYDCTTQNAIKCQFVIQERLPGQSIEAIYDSLTLDERLHLASALAKLIKRIDSVILPRFGRLVQSTPMPEVSYAVPQSSNDGAIGVAGYRLSASADMPVTDEKSLSSVLRVMCTTRSEEDSEDEELQSYWQRLQQMITEMESIELLSGIEEEPRLWHWDLSAQNVLVDKVSGLWTITGVLDWDDAISVPGVIGRKAPVWLWRPEVRVEDADTTEPIALGDDQKLIKERFEEAITSSLPSFPDDAYHRGRWLRRLMAFALHGFSYSQDWDRYKALIQDWNIHYLASSDVKHV